MQQPISQREKSKILSNNFTMLKVPLPWKLWQLLEDSERNGTQSIVSWLPAGDGFSVFNPADFAGKVMQLYLPYSNYKAFKHEV